MVKKKRSSSKKTGDIHVALYAAAGILIFLLLSTIYDLIMGDVDTRRLFTLQIAITGLTTIGSIIGFRKIYRMVKQRL